MAERPGQELPTGTVTFLFTDVEGSTRMWEQHPNEMTTALAVHDEILRTAIEANNGYVFSTAGDAFAAAFQNHDDAITAAQTAHHLFKTSFGAPKCGSEASRAASPIPPVVPPGTRLAQ
ncbi:MAG: adenylate/guanylate cyclase domain-containing protein [Actinomycetota bacterium]